MLGVRFRAHYPQNMAPKKTTFPLRSLKQVTERSLRPGERSALLSEDRVTRESSNGPCSVPRGPRLAPTPYPSVPPRLSPSTKPSAKHSGLTASLGLLLLMKAPCHIKLGLNQFVDFSPVHPSLSVSRTQQGTLRRSWKTFSSPCLLTLISNWSALG